MKMNDVKQTSRRRNQIINMPYINTVYRTTQYDLYIQQKYVRTIQFLNCDEQFLKKNRKRGSFEQLVRQTAFSKIFENITYARKCTIHAPCIWCLYGACMVHVWCMYGACMVHVWCMYGAFRELGLKQSFFLYGANRLLCHHCYQHRNHPPQ